MNMNYEKIYADFIADRKAKEPEVYRGKTHKQRIDTRYGMTAWVSGEYMEQHHIVPRHVFRDKNELVDNSDKNIVALNAKDHFKAHVYYALAFPSNKTWSAVDALANFPGSTKSRLMEFDEDELELLAIAREESSKFNSEAARIQHAETNLSELANSKEAKAKKSETMKKRYAENPEAWANQRKVVSSPEFVAKRAATQKAKYDAGEYDHIKQARSKAWSENNPMDDPELRAKSAAAIKAHCAKPEVKAAKSARLKEYNPMTTPEAIAKAKATKSANFEKHKANVAKRPVLYNGEIMSIRQVMLRERAKGNRFQNDSISERANKLGISLQESVDWYVNTTNEHREELRKQSRSKPVICLDTGDIFPSAKKAAEWAGMRDATGIPAVCKGKSKHSGGYRWAYA